MKWLGVVIWRLRHSRLRREFHALVSAEVTAAGPKGWVPDVGSGPGLLAMRLADASPGARLVCVDVEPGMLRAAQEAGCPYTVRGTADRLPIRSGTCGTVVSTATLKDWANRKEGLSEIARLLEPGGRAFVYDFVTVGPGSKPAGFVRRFGLIAELLRRRMARMIPFSLADLAELAADVRDPRVQVQLAEVPEFGAAKLLLYKSVPP